MGMGEGGRKGPCERQPGHPRLAKNFCLEGGGVCGEVTPIAADAVDGLDPCGGEAEGSGCL